MPRLILVDEGQMLFDGPLGSLRTALGSKRRLRLEFTSDPGPVHLPLAQFVSDEGTAKHYLITDETTSLIDVLAQVPQGFGLRDVAVEEPTIEEVIRTFYQNKPVPTAAGAA